MTHSLTRHGRTLAALTLSLVIPCAARPDPSAAVARADDEKPRPRAPKTRVENLPANVSARFEPNAGQADPRVKFVSRGGAHTLLLAADGATLALRKDDERESRGAGASSFRLLHMKFVGANARAEVLGEGETHAKVNYLLGRDPSKWRTNVPTFASVRYRELYRGVDLVYHDGGGDRLEYDFVVAPGADYSPVRLRFEGADSLSVDPASGDLLVRVGGETVRQSKPVVYQNARGERREVEGRYVLRGEREVGFGVGAYDPSLPLVIDPVLVYSTFFLTADSMAVDPSGGVYVAGTVEGVGLAATPGAYQTTVRGIGDAFVAKLDASGRELSYLTYLGGSAGPTGGGERAHDIAVDAAGNAYVTGHTDSTDFPVVNAFQPASAGGGMEGFVAKLNPAGSSLVYASYVGGSATDLVSSVVADASGHAYLYGDTESADFPLKNPLQSSKKGISDLFLMKVAPDGASLVYSTFLGGGSTEIGYQGDIAVDSSGSLYVASTTYSDDYPVTPGAFQPSPNNEEGFFTTEVVVSKLAPDGSSLVYSTFLGGARWDSSYAIAVDGAGQAHVAGETSSEDFPTKDALYPAARDPYGNGFLTKLNAAGTALVYSTYLSGTPPRCGFRRLFDMPVFCSGESATAVATDAAGNAYVTGYAISKDFPAPVMALQPNLVGASDAFVIKLDPTGGAVYSTYLGGSSHDGGGDLHADASGTLYVFGWASSSDFPLVNPFRDRRARELSPHLYSFVAKISDAETTDQLARVRFDSDAYEGGEGDGGITVTVERTGDTSGALSVEYATGDGFASERTDYTTARGTLRFAPGETAKTFSVLLTNDASVEGDETFSLTLNNLVGSGAALEGPASATLTIRDDDERPTDENPIDGSEFFVRQHYHDFLNREPDFAGLQFWAGLIESCGNDAACREAKRVQVSAAFFLSIEFQNTGFLVERLYRLAFGLHVPYESFVHDARRIGDGVVVGQQGWEGRLDANKRAYAEEFAARTPFKERFAATLTASEYVEKLNTQSGGSLSQTERDALVAALEAGTKTRAEVLLEVADDSDFVRREFSTAFVLMQYLGYLRRDPGAWPDNGVGFDFWLAKLNRFGGDWRAAELVRAFINSIEYRARFNEPAKEATKGVPFSLDFGERAVVVPDKLAVQFADVGFDSRCPRGSQCPTQGKLDILLRVTRPGGETTYVLLTIAGGVPRPHAGNAPVSAFGYKFTLLQLDPEPPYPPPPFRHTALLLVEKE